MGDRRVDKIAHRPIEPLIAENFNSLREGACN